VDVILPGARATRLFDETERIAAERGTTSFRKAMVLLVDDDNDVRAAVAGMLEGRRNRLISFSAAGTSSISINTFYATARSKLPFSNGRSAAAAIL
jgi:hypothetical protein